MLGHDKAVELAKLFEMICAHGSVPFVVLLDWV
jgi:hypothetical protein